MRSAPTDVARRIRRGTNSGVGCVAVWPTCTAVRRCRRPPTIVTAEALAALDTTTPLGQLAATVCRPVSKDGKRYRALQPFSAEDRALLEAISDGAYVTGGFCNGDLASRLYGAKSERCGRAKSDCLEGLVPIAHPSRARSDPQIARPPALSHDQQRSPNRNRPPASTTCHATTT